MNQETSYIPETIEKKWQKYWEEKGIFKNYSRDEKFYVLDMFPYPSGEGLHVGHPKGYIATDVVARYQQLRGKSVLHPMGWDAFGLPAENYALKNKLHPRISVEKNIKRFKSQLEAIGCTYDWDREIDTTDPDYYRWTQWIFLKLFEKGLAYESHEPINWCPSCKTGLANEDLENGKCERCGSDIEQKPMRQWVLKMTEYAERLLRDLDSEDLDWETSIVEQQKNWIGRSEGAEVDFGVKGSDVNIRVFTTRVDTIFGCTYVVVAPEHVILETLQENISNSSEVAQYIADANKKTNLERTELQKEKTGVKLEGVEVINPFTGETVPIFVADYVLGNYGTGAVMAVPAHDERDFEFAKKYTLPIRRSIVALSQCDHQGEIDECYADDGILIDSGEYTGLSSEEAREKMVSWLEEGNLGKKKINYKMRDWVFSRQRYWGGPIPIIHCESCGAVAVPEDELPLRLPEVESYEPTGTGEGPLSLVTDWVNATCPICGSLAKRETNTMPQWAGSSWYYLAYIMKECVGVSLNNAKDLFEKWTPVDLYVGGQEHATRHLLYARFWHKFLFDIGIVPTKEPFKKLMHVGLINAQDGRKMSKRWNNVINPDEMIMRFGADALRLYEMFMGPFSQAIAWNTEGVSGVRRFLDKVWKLGMRTIASENSSQVRIHEPVEGKNTEVLFHKTIRKVAEDIEAFKFNTAVSSLMILVNSIEKRKTLRVEEYKTFLVLLSPFAPHISEELWERFGETQSIFLAAWPAHDESKLHDEDNTIVVQVNGKLRDTFVAPVDISEEEMRRCALESENVRKHIAGKEMKKVVIVKGKLVSIVM